MSQPLIPAALAHGMGNATIALPLDPQIPLSNSTATSGLVPSLQGWVTNFAANAAAVTATMDNAAIDVGKAAVVFLIIAGVVLWFTRVNKHLGKELLEGGLVIGMFIQFVVPFLMTIHLP